MTELNIIIKTKQSLKLSKYREPVLLYDYNSANYSSVIIIKVIKE